MSSAAPYSTVAKSGQPIRNNGGVVPRGGNIATGGPITSAPDNLTQGYTSRGVGGTTPFAKTGANIGTTKPISSRAFGYVMEAGKFLMYRYGFIGGTASTFLNSGAADYGRRSINWKTNQRSWHVTSWNYATGAATKGADTNDSFGADNAAEPTRAIPGEFQYTEHGMAKSGSLAVATMADYPAKTN